MLKFVLTFLGAWLVIHFLRFLWCRHISKNLLIKHQIPHAHWDIYTEEMLTMSQKEKETFLREIRKKGDV